MNYKYDEYDKYHDLLWTMYYLGMLSLEEWYQRNNACWDRLDEI